jgi:quercetin dioxygenase-like cupin family protein
MSLREAAQRADLSPSFVGLVERGETEIAISRLVRLTDVYGGVVADLLADVHEPAYEYIAAGQAMSVPTNVAGVKVLYLASPSWQMEPFEVRMEPGSRLAELRHAGEEFIYCMEGCPTLIVAGRAQPMSAGDTVFVPPLAEHAYVNDSNSRAVLIGAAQRPEHVRLDAEPIWRRTARRTQRGHAHEANADDT